MTSIKKEEIINVTEYSKKHELINNLNEIYDTLPSGDCAGCGKCCMESVSINLIEFINILDYLNSNENIKKKSIKKIIEYYFLEYVEKKSCPFKQKDNKCMIYPVRPLNCRLYGHWLENDYNRNLDNVNNKNKEYQKLVKEQYGFDINEQVVNYKIEYCNIFKPEKRYLTKAERLEIIDKLFLLDAKIFSTNSIDIEFKDRGIVEYFIEYLLKDELAYKIKIKISKDETIRNIAIKRLKQILV